jgi:hypothetical protein
MPGARAVLFVGLAVVGFEKTKEFAADLFRDMSPEPVTA